MNKSSTLFLTKNERELILKYGYPFEEIEQQLNEAEGKQIIRVSDHKYWWEQVVVNLHISETEQTNPELLKNLRTLIDRIAIETEMV